MVIYGACNVLSLSFDLLQTTRQHTWRGRLYTVRVASGNLPGSLGRAVWLECCCHLTWVKLVLSTCKSKIKNFPPCKNNVSCLCRLASVPRSVICMRFTFVKLLGLGVDFTFANNKNKNKNPHLIFHRRRGTRGLKFGTQTYLTILSSDMRKNLDNQ